MPTRHRERRDSDSERKYESSSDEGTSRVSTRVSARINNQATHSKHNSDYDETRNEMSRDRSRDREKHREVGREKNGDRNREKEKVRDRDSTKYRNDDDYDSDKNRNRDRRRKDEYDDRRDRHRDRDRDRNGAREERNRDRDRDHDRDRNRDRDRERGKDRDRDERRDRDRDRDRRRDDRDRRKDDQDDSSKKDLGAEEETIMLILKLRQQGVSENEVLEALRLAQKAKAMAGIPSASTSNKGGYQQREAYNNWNGWNDNGYAHDCSNNAGPGPRDVDNLFSGIHDVEWKNETLETLIKDFYIEDERVTTWSEKQVEEYRRENNIFVRDKRCPRPVPSFEMVGLPPEVQNLLNDFAKPTPIQAQGLPIALSGHSMVGVAETGSGKTLAFLIPAMLHVAAQPPVQPGQGPIVLIISPTRELALQIHDEGEKYLSLMNQKIVCLYGGGVQSVDAQSRRLAEGPQFVVACPGRLGDHLNRQNTNLKRVTYFVLDEADRLLDMGFQESIRKVSRLVRQDRQTLMWSATWPRFGGVADLAREIFITEDPIILRVGQEENIAVGTVEHEFVSCRNGSDATDQLTKYLQDKASLRILIFANTKANCENLRNMLNSRLPKCKAAALHGDKTQHEREATLREFRDGRCNLLIATDVLSRGLDIKNVHTVVNYDMPKCVEDWIHRVGRTGRAGASGHSLNLIKREDEYLVQNLRPTLALSYGSLPQTYLDSVNRGGCQTQASSTGWAQEDVLNDSMQDSWGNKQNDGRYTEQAVTVAEPQGEWDRDNAW